MTSARASNAATVAVDGLQMRYGTKDVLRDIAFQVGRGEVVALLAPNGVGKTTTVKILEGFRRRSAGRIEVLGTDPEAADEFWQARLGVVLQSWRDHAKWRVRQFLAYQAGYYTPYSTAGELARQIAARTRCAGSTAGNASPRPPPTPPGSPGTCSPATGRT